MLALANFKGWMQKHKYTVFVPMSLCSIFFFYIAPAFLLLFFYELNRNKNTLVTIPEDSFVLLSCWLKQNVMKFPPISWKGSAYGK